MSASLQPSDFAGFARLGIGPELLSAAHVQRVDDREAKDVFGIQYSGDKSGLVFPYYIRDRRVTARLRRDNPEVDPAGKPQHKYIAAWGDHPHCYFPPNFLETAAADPDVKLVAVEAEKSALAGTAWAKRTGAKFIFFAMGGCWGWRGRIGKTESPSGARVEVKGPLPDLAVCDERTVYVMLDANVAVSAEVQRAEKALVGELRKRGCKVLTCRIPSLKSVNGPDDLIGTAGDDALAKVLAKASDAPHAAEPSRARLVRLSDVKAKDVDWLWAPYFPIGMLAMVSGDSDVGKSYMLQALAAGLTLGQLPCGGGRCEKSSILHFTNENSAEYTLRPRFDKLGGDPTRYFHCPGSEFTDEKGEVHTAGITLADIPMLDGAIAESQAKLVLIDPIQSYLPSKTDAHRANEVRQLLDPLAKLAEKHACCIVLIRHLSKGVGGKAIYRGSMSVDFTAAVRSEMLVGYLPDDHNKRAIVHIVHNVGPVGASVGFEIDPEGEFSWTGQSDITAEQILADPTHESSEVAGALREACEWLKDFLTPDSRDQGECKKQAELNGISFATLKRAKAHLKVKSRKASFKGGFIWSLTEVDQAPLTLEPVEPLRNNQQKTGDLDRFNDLSHFVEHEEYLNRFVEDQDLSHFVENDEESQAKNIPLSHFVNNNNNKDLSIYPLVTNAEEAQVPRLPHARAMETPNGFDPVV
jgi:DNA repair protein RadA/Sms